MTSNLHWAPAGSQAPTLTLITTLGDEVGLAAPPILEELRPKKGPHSPCEAELGFKCRTV